MYYLYILRSEAKERHYIGICADTIKRLAQHNCGGVTSTKAYRPWRIVHVEEFYDKTSARKREIFLKRTARARVDLYKKINNGLIV